MPLFPALCPFPSLRSVHFILLLLATLAEQLTFLSWFIVLTPGGAPFWVHLCPRVLACYAPVFRGRAYQPLLTRIAGFRRPFTLRVFISWFFCSEEFAT